MDRKTPSAIPLRCTRLLCPRHKMSSIFDIMNAFPSKLMGVWIIFTLTLPEEKI